MPRFLRRLLALVAGVTVSAFVAAGPSTSASAQALIDEILQKGEINVGLSTFVPWSMRNNDGDLIGFEIDVAKRLGEDLGVEVNLVPTAWDGIIPALMAGKFDVIISGMSITTKRNLTVNFTTPYARSGMGLAANKELAAGRSTIEDFNDSDVTLTVRRGSTAASTVQELFPKATIRQFDDDNIALQEVLNGNATATITSEPKPTFYTIDHADTIVKPLGEQLLTRNTEAFALRKGDVDTLNVFNNWILQRTNDGWLQARHDFWFTTRDWADQVPN